MLMELQERIMVNTIATGDAAMTTIAETTTTAQIGTATTTTGGAEFHGPTNAKR
jgi:hypothetical protein